MQALVRIVVEQMGGSASAGELAQRCWDHMQQLKYRHDASQPRPSSSATPKKFEGYVMNRVMDVASVALIVI